MSTLRTIARIDRKNQSDRLESALAALIRRIELGQEYPDAEWLVASLHGVACHALRDAYDSHCAEKNLEKS